MCRESDNWLTAHFHAHIGHWAQPTCRKEAAGVTSELQRMTVDRLREKLRAAKLSATGTKKTLTDRLAAHLSKSGPSSSHPRRSQRQSASSRDHQQDDNNPSQSNQHSSNGDHQRDSPGTSSSQHRQVRYRLSRQRDSPTNSSLPRPAPPWETPRKSPPPWETPRESPA